MTSSATTARAAIRRCWPWGLFTLAVLWAILLRLPLVLNARAHLDSDLAVDGLTLLDAVRGHWRWHYPGTPHIGILPVVFSLPQAYVFGANPMTLVSGGVVAYVILMLAVFVTAWRAFGPAVAAWSLVPLTFASTGALWLSGRVTGGHLTAAAWHAAAFGLLYEALSKGTRRWAIGLGLWCGLGLWVDSMFLVTLLGLVPATLGAWWAGGCSRKNLQAAALCVAAFLVGTTPREVGARVDPHDPYHEQFGLVDRRDVLTEHAQILAQDCLPRLIAGHRLPGLEADPDPLSLTEPGPESRLRDDHPAALAVTAVSLPLFVAALAGLVFFGLRDPGATFSRLRNGTASRVAGLSSSKPRSDGPNPGVPKTTPQPPNEANQEAIHAPFLSPRNIPARAVCWGLAISAAATIAGFVVNQKIFNSDNYRYLVDLLVPWAVGFGLVMHSLSQRGRGGSTAAFLIAGVLALLMTADAARWYSRFGWIDERGWSTRADVNDPALTWLNEHREVHRILGGYWDVYRLAFLTGGRVEGVPFTRYPDRFRSRSSDWRVGRPQFMIVRRSRQENEYLSRALQEGARVQHQERRFVIVFWP